MEVLKAFHEKMPTNTLGKKGSFAPFDFIFYTGNLLEKEATIPSHFSVALRRVQTIFNELKPWLTENAKLCHGDFTKHNVLLSKDFTPVLIDFDSASMGDPLFDVIKFSLPLSNDQRFELFKAYLGKQTPSIEEVKHFKAMDLSMLMLIATLRFQSAPKNPSPEMLSVAKMEALLDSEKALPSFLNIPFEDTSAKARQLGALYALAEFLKKSEEIKTL